jgi:GMP synthase-like glutamine amidotransferase
VPTPQNMSVHIGLLECDDVVGRFPEIAGGYREMFAALLPQARFAYYEAHRGELPRAPNECQAWLCTGSKYSVYEPHPWIERLSAFTRDVRDADQPFVGICFGHQMLAHALGGVVTKSPYGWGVGVLKVDILEHEPWMQPPLREVRMHHMHQDHVERLPHGAIVLGRSDHCEIGMFRIGERMLGIEGHPEFTVPFSAALIRARREHIGALRADEALASLSQPTNAALVAKWISGFLKR